MKAFKALHDKKRILFLHMQSDVEKGEVLVDSCSQGEFAVMREHKDETDRSFLLGRLTLKKRLYRRFGRLYK
jgi:hypothetical protein